MPDLESLRPRIFWFSLTGVFLLIALLIYGQSLGNEFVHFDDGPLIFLNPIVLEFSPSTIARAFSSYDPELYIPLTLLTYQLNHLIGGVDPFGYHLVNVLLHTGNAVLLAGTAGFLSKKRWIGAVTGLLFLVHPLNVEAVAWASARKDLLATFFFLFSLGLLLHARERQSARLYWGSVGSFLLALLSKVSAVTLPAVVLILDWGRGQKITIRRAVSELLPFAVLAVIFALVAAYGKVATGSLLPEKLLLGAKATIFYLQTLAWPAGLSVLYPYTRSISLDRPDILLSVLGVVSITVASILLLRRSRLPLAAWVFFVAMLFPSFGNIAKGQEALRDIYFASDRYAYVASMSVFFLVAIGLYQASRRWVAVTHALIVCVVLIFGVLSHRQSLVWKTTENLFIHAIGHYPNAQYAHATLGALLSQKGDVQGALREYDVSLAIRPSGKAATEKAVVLEEAGDIAGAEEAYRLAIRANPFIVNARINLAVLLLRQERRDEAALLLREAIELIPAQPKSAALRGYLFLAHFNFGEVLVAQGRPAEALREFQKALEIDPNDPETQERIRGLGGGQY